MLVDSKVLLYTTIRPWVGQTKRTLPMGRLEGRPGVPGEVGVRAAFSARRLDDLGGVDGEEEAEAKAAAAAAARRPRRATRSFSNGNEGSSGLMIPLFNASSSP